jgi:membrane carboxypeptidase/penicillin-binding protein PbpC
MSNFNPELIKRLAMGDSSAYDELKELPLVLKMAMGAEVDKMQRDQNIIPTSNNISIYEKIASKYTSDDEVAKAMADRMRQQKENEERMEKAKEEHMQRVVEEQVKRARSGLTRNDR